LGGPTETTPESDDPDPNLTEPASRAKHALQELRRSLLIPILCGVMIASWLIGAHAGGLAQAAEVKKGETVRPNILRGVLSLRAEKVCVGWIGPREEKPNSLSLDKPLVLLGQANATLILYRGGNEGIVDLGPVRIPAGKAVLLPSNGDTCPLA
jgi:hypothetical protein